MHTSVEIAAKAARRPLGLLKGPEVGHCMVVIRGAAQQPGKFQLTVSGMNDRAWMKLWKAWHEGGVYAIADLHIQKSTQHSKVIGI